MLLSFGIQMGSYLAFWVDGKDNCEPTGDAGWYAGFAVVAALAEVVLSRGEALSKRTWIWAVCVAVIGYLVYDLAREFGNYATTAFAGAFVIGFLANVYARAGFTPSPFTTTKIATSLISPGALALRGVAGLFGEAGKLGTTDLLLSVVEVSIGIFAGLFVARLVVFADSMFNGQVRI